MEKYIPIEEVDYRTGLPNVTQFHPGAMEKTAELAGPMTEFLKTLVPDPNEIYLVINAMSAGEFYSSNRNGDYFNSSELVRTHPTFVSDAKVYKHHKNKPTSPSYGRVLFSYYNPEMHRVELVVTIDRRLAPDLVTRIDAGEYLPWSMGVKVPYDVCSICGNRAKTMAKYCSHLKRPNINSIDPMTGKKSYAINEKITRFFDISVVRINADRTAFTMRKVASLHSEKHAAIVKKTPAEVVAIGNTPKEALIRASQGNMSQDFIKELTKTADLETILRTMLGMRVLPTKTDFQNIVLHNAHKEDLARYLDRKGLIFPNSDGPLPVNLPKHFSMAAADKILNSYPTSIHSKPTVLVRIMRMQKTASPEREIHTVPELHKIAGLYQWYIKEFNTGQLDHGPLVKSAKLMNILYPRNALFSKEAGAITYNIDAPGSYMSEVDPTVEPGGIKIPTQRFTSYGVEKRGLSLQAVLEDIVKQNSSLINHFYENIA